MINDKQDIALLETEKRVHKFVQKRNAKQFAERIAAFISGAVFFTIAVLTIYFGLAIAEEGAWYFEPLTKAWNWFSAIVTKPEQGWAVKMGISIGVMYALSIAISLVISIVVPLFYIKKKFECPQNKSVLDRIKAMETNINSEGGSVFLLVYAVLYALFVAISTLYLMLFYGGSRIDSFEEIFGAVFALVFVLAVSVLISAILFGLLWFINCVIFAVAKPTKLLKEVEELKKIELSRIESENAEKRRRAEEDKARQKAKEKKMMEKARKEREEARQEELKKAEEIYNKAMASEEPDEGLLEEAAHLGNLDASRYMGKKLVTEWSVSEASNRGKEKILRKAEGILSIFANGGDATGEFLWLLCNCTLNSHNPENWKKILRRLEKIEDSGEVEKEFTGTLALLINEVEKRIEATASKKAAIQEQDDIGVPDCKFRNGAICTYSSTSMTIAKCDYVNNPFSCIYARDNKSIYFRK